MLRDHAYPSSFDPEFEAMKIPHPERPMDTLGFRIDDDVEWNNNAGTEGNGTIAGFQEDPDGIVYAIFDQRFSDDKILVDVRLLKKEPQKKHS